jgi:hypothetical protein
VSDPQNAIAGALDTDPSAPNAARIYDYLLAGQDNYDADRQAAKRLLRAVPGARQAARDNRAFLARVVRHLARQGITQFLDIGCGLPAAPSVHEVAWQVAPAARVVYADNDPVVAAHARALPAARAARPLVGAVQADLRHPRNLLTARPVRDVLDLSQPVAVLLAAVLHFIEDADDPHGIVATITERVAPGSWIAVSHVTDDDLEPGAALTARAACAGASVPAVPRSREAVARFLAGLEVAGPGVTDIRCWRRPGPPPSGPVLLYGGAARVPAR